MSGRADIAVVGGGPAGLSAAVNALARGKTVRLLSSGKTNLKHAENVDNYLGFYKITGGELMDRFEEHAAVLGISAEKGKVSNIMPLGGYFMLNFAGQIVEASAVVLAIGTAKAREIAGEAEFLGRGVSYCATCDGMLYRGRKAVVWGVAPDSAEEANFLHSIGAQIVFVAKGERPENLKPEIPFIPGAVSEIVGEGSVSAVRTGGDLIETDGVFILRNAIAPTTLVPGLETQNGFIRVDSRMQTNIPGLFAAGDCTGAPLQIAKAVGEGLRAAQAAAKYIDSLGK
jgi:thioredoxin reductase (NADPH)